MARSKIIYNNNTLIDLTPSTAIADDVAEGKKFYLANGNSAIGTSQGGGGGEDYEISVEPELSLTRSISTLPTRNDSCCAVIYRNEIHILGNPNSPYNTHYKWDGTEWTSVSTLPYSFNFGSAVVYNDEIHILGSSVSGNQTYHYKWDGTSWSSVSTLPSAFYGYAVVYNNEIHILGGYYGTKHYKWDGEEWVSQRALSVGSSQGCAVVYNNEIHVLGGNNVNSYKSHYKWSGDLWTSVSTLPYEFYNGSAVVYNNEIHILGGYGNTTGHYKWDGAEWVKLDDLPYTFNKGSAVVYCGEIQILGSSYNNYYAHYALASEPTTTPTLNITANGIYNIIGSKTEQSLNKLVTDLTGEVSCGINVEIDTSGTATADKIASGYTAWVNGEKLTGTMATGGTMYSTTQKPSSTSSVTFSNLEIPYANISHYMAGSVYYSSTGVSLIIDGQAYSAYYSSNIKISTLSGLSVSGSGNSITFTKSNGFSKSYAYSLIYC